MGDQDQYEADLAQALALSLETHAIETLRRQERPPPTSQQSVQSPHTWPHNTAGELVTMIHSAPGLSLVQMWYL